MQEGINHLSEEISTLKERFNEFSSRMEEFNSKFSAQRASMNQHNLAGQGEACNGSVPTSLFLSNLGNGTLLPGSSFPSQLNKDSPVMEEVCTDLINFFSRRLIYSFELCKCGCLLFWQDPLLISPHYYIFFATEARKRIIL